MSNRWPNGRRSDWRIVDGDGEKERRSNEPTIPQDGELEEYQEDWPEVYREDRLVVLKSKFFSYVSIKSKLGLGGVDRRSFRKGRSRLVLSLVALTFFFGLSWKALDSLRADPAATRAAAYLIGAIASGIVASLGLGRWSSARLPEHTEDQGHDEDQADD